MRALLTCLILTILLAPPALAEDVDPGKALLEKVTELRKAEDVNALTEAIGQIPGVYADAAPALQGKLRAELGKVLKDQDLGSARQAALDVFIGIDDPKNAWKEVGKCMPDRKAEEPPEVDVAIVRSAGVFAQSKAIKPLLELAGKAKSAKLSAAAVAALGGYGKDRKNRVKIYEELVDIAKKTRPGRSTEKAVSDEAQERWGLMEPAVVAALNELTGQNLAKFDDWEAMAKEYKRNPKDLFISGD